ncbi:Sporulation related domain-containing protein [Azospirillum lipoferum]|nr:Sporulation related domain-containing protein [Azospirillum lipoferum]
MRGHLLEQASAAPGTAPGTNPAAQPAAAATSAPAPAPKEPPAEPLVFSVAVGRFLLEDNAARRLAEAQAKGFQPVVVVADPPDPSGWLTVTLGPRDDATAAARLAEDATAQGFDTLLVSWLAP